MLKRGIDNVHAVTVSVIETNTTCKLMLFGCFTLGDIFIVVH